MVKEKPKESYLCSHSRGHSINFYYYLQYHMTLKYPYEAEAEAFFAIRAKNSLFCCLVNFGQILVSSSNFY